MTGSVMWVIAAGAFSVSAVLTRRLFLAPFALGAALAAAVDGAGVGTLAAWIVFVLSSVVTLLVTAPIVRSRRHELAIRSRSRALIGKRAIVLEQIINQEGVGCIKIDGQVWTARALDDDRVIERGARVEVVEIKGATAVVVDDHRQQVR